MRRLLTNASDEQYSWGIPMTSSSQQYKDIPHYKIDKNSNSKKKYPTNDCYAMVGCPMFEKITPYNPYTVENGSILLPPAAHEVLDNMITYNDRTSDWIEGAVWTLNGTEYNIVQVGYFKHHEEHFVYAILEQLDDKWEIFCIYSFPKEYAEKIDRSSKVISYKPDGAIGADAVAWLQKKCIDYTDDLA